MLHGFSVKSRVWQNQAKGSTSQTWEAGEEDVGHHRSASLHSVSAAYPQGLRFQSAVSPSASPKDPVRGDSHSHSIGEETLRSETMSGLPTVRWEPVLSPHSGESPEHCQDRCREGPHSPSL